MFLSYNKSISNIKLNKMFEYVDFFIVERKGD